MKLFKLSLCQKFGLNFPSLTCGKRIITNNNITTLVTFYQESWNLINIFSYMHKVFGDLRKKEFEL